MIRLEIDEVAGAVCAQTLVEAGDPRALPRAPIQRSDHRKAVDAGGFLLPHAAEGARDFQKLQRPVRLLIAHAGIVHAREIADAPARVPRGEDDLEMGALARHIVHIEKMFEIVVKQNLLVFPGTTREEITTITSHDQAIKQCRMYLKRMFPTADIAEYPDTAQAAKDLGEGVLSKNTAIIAPKACAELYGLEVLEENINDLKFNVTNFLVVVK